MIVDPDFVDHWKTRMLVAMLGDDELAPVYVLRLWAHCQNRRVWVFDLPAMALKGICRFAGDDKVFEDAMAQAKFISRNGSEITVIGWEEYNASLIAAWSNGGKGGRPRKTAGETPAVNPQDNPSKTRGIPMGEPIRGDEIREEMKVKSKAEPAQPPALPDWMPLDSWGGYLQMRKKIKKAPTDRAVALVIAALSKMRSEGQDITAVLDKSTRNSWVDVYPIRDNQPRAGPDQSTKFDPTAAVNRNRIQP